MTVFGEFSNGKETKDLISQREHKDPEFWFYVLLVQVREFEKDIRKNNMEHAAKELTDILMVSLDALYFLFGEKTIVQHLIDRISDYSCKGTSNRDKKFYLDKLHRLEKELGYLPYPVDLPYPVECANAWDNLVRRLRDDTFD